MRALSAFVTAVILSASLAPAAETLWLAPSSHDPTPLTLLPGEHFQIEMFLNAEDYVASGLMYLSASAVDTIRLHSATFSSPWTTGGPIELGVFDPDLLFAFGGSSIGEPPGEYHIASLTLSIDSHAPPGAYTLNSYIPAVYPDRFNIGGARSVAVGPPVVIHVVPEPSSVLLCSTAGLCMLAFYCQRTKLNVMNS